MERVTIAEAAEMLGITRDGVRKRIRRNSISWEEDSDGTVYVYVDASATAEDESADTSGQEQLVEVMREQIEHLKEQLNRADERDKENRRIIAALTQRIPELEAPRETRGSPLTDEEVSPSGSPGDTQEPQRRERSWWRRFFDL